MVSISSNLPPSGTFGAFKPPKPQKKSFLPYLVIVAVVLALAAGYYLFKYRGVNFSFVAPVLPVASSLTSTEIKVGQLPYFNFDVFDSSFYRELKNYGALPIVADQLGRVNPFVPF